MNVLIVYAHPEPNSFNGALKELAVRVLTEQGHQVQVSDLYAMNFKAVADRDDFENCPTPNFSNTNWSKYTLSKTDCSPRTSPPKWRNSVGLISCCSNSLSGGSPFPPF